MTCAWPANRDRKIEREVSSATKQMGYPLERDRYCRREIQNRILFTDNASDTSIIDEAGFIVERWSFALGLELPYSQAHCLPEFVRQRFGAVLTAIIVLRPQMFPGATSHSERL